MKLVACLFILFSTAIHGTAQTKADLFNEETPISWLGIDYSHLTVIGDFSQFGSWGKKSAAELNKYFTGWNEVVLNERDKYNIGRMLRKEKVLYHPEMIMEHNDTATAEKAYSEPHYTPEDIQNFVKEYKLQGKKGIGIVFIAEAYNKAATQATHRFVAINMKSGEVLLQQKLVTEPGGFGLRNYWAGSIHKAMEKIEDNYYEDWEDQYTE